MEKEKFLAVSDDPAKKALLEQYIRE